MQSINYLNKLQIFFFFLNCLLQGCITNIIQVQYFSTEIGFFDKHRSL